ncbi:hypothetical protein PHYBLDRAFT_147208 [Phycomyces blakesleeanus NRRL 1555(-)]|uniref:Uncharacterized protein n=1 Tax=Phycomyces blakesleeanus (strain ATCC 8743b / DSM 1359 / FGSC 10004 / NBRC 33097 / NRRL 1555) TaxID=763407 RepID=A0A162WXU9_PHYB8|nr:hypothetical protein PHYBLDRAFT_147208 [Phycomyces blakesleeanus NRRL 1555(-)]OAD71445.1 hypothetical protein PHYBLDRAFT_147208 [Phycomyces blakesleeanus NRRL 1555(-)]|eukprot:XP_018289485.1 hypothetical protein PHYBLDRAFT_147208 [Phycomyces blakesleeanus NRRL 1555(-)]
MFEQLSSTRNNLPKVPALSIQFNPFDPPLYQIYDFFTYIKHDRGRLNDTSPEPNISQIGIGTTPKLHAKNGSVRILQQ